MLECGFYILALRYRGGGFPYSIFFSILDEIPHPFLGGFGEFPMHIFGITFPSLPLQRGFCAGARQWGL